jgi:hypothetical protein
MGGRLTHLGYMGDGRVCYILYAVALGTPLPT